LFARIMLPKGYSISHGPRSVKPALRQTAFDGALSTAGKA